MNGNSLPGFYWDDTRKKYFRVQANHIAPAGSQYSREAIKRKKIDDERKNRQQAAHRRVKLERVQTSRCMDYVSTRLAREIGNSFQVPKFVKQSHQAKVYVSQLESHKVCSEGVVNVVDFARHGGSGEIVSAACVPNYSTLSLFPSQTTPTAQDVWQYDTPLRMKMECEVSSMSISDNGFILLTCIDGIYGESELQLGVIPDQPSTMTDHRWTGHWIRSPFPDAPEATYWCSAARPTCDSGPDFAVGTSEALELIHFNPTCVEQDFLFETGSRDILAVEWLSTNLIASGLRDASMFLSDVRSRGSAQRLRHPGSIGQIRRVDESRVLVAGTNSLHMYDLRYTKIEDKPDPKSSRWRHGRGASSRPYLVFDNYTCDVYHSMDFNDELGLLASVTQDRKSISFYSVADGSIIPSPVSIQEMKDLPGSVGRIRFEKFQYPLNHKQSPRLVFARGPEIIELAW